MRNSIITQSALLAMAVALLAPVAACGGSDEAQSAAAALQGVTEVQSASGGSTCTLITAQELEAIVLMPVQPSSAAVSAGGCVWDTPDDPDGFVMVAVVSGDYWEKPNHSPGYKALSGIGSEAFVINELDGWKAGALLTGEMAIVVRVDVSGETEAMAVELLQKVVSNANKKDEEAEKKANVTN